MIEWIVPKLIGGMLLFVGLGIPIALLAMLGRTSGYEKLLEKLDRDRGK